MRVVILGRDLVPERSGGHGIPKLLTFPTAKL